MTIIKPVSDLRKKADELAEIVRTSGEPIFLTRDGEGDMVLMSLAEFNRLRKKLELFGKLAVAQSHIAAGDKGRDVEDVFADIDKLIDDAG
ncbi:MAG: type II toxin-antitoxin system Phd/YefM family antitoxin [Planctomycetes bacterium]|nr:type II toxin-antitoxin system Phd/YefM family antitoxin [Planctomycetota bacterium]